MNSTGFSVRGVEHLRELFSKRTQQVQKLAEESLKKIDHRRGDFLTARKR
jgi:hypothetical protein